jgi:antitoxin ParD1/3/4
MMKQISLKVPETYLDAIDDLVRAGFYPNRAELIRLAIRDLIVKETA